MPCTACGNNKTHQHQSNKISGMNALVSSAPQTETYRSFAQIKRQDLKPYPYDATDLQVYQDGKMMGFNQELHFPKDKHKLIIFYPESNTPVCETELGALQDWIAEFEKLDVHVVAATIDFVPVVKDWFIKEESLKSAKYPVLSSRTLPQRLGLLRSNGTLRRSSVFIMKDGETVKIEHFDKVGRSLNELHRMVFGYSTDSYCAEGWKSPEDGFLTPPKKKKK